MKLGFRFAFHLECVGGKESSFTLNGNAGKMEILEEKKIKKGIVSVVCLTGRMGCL